MCLFFHSEEYWANWTNNRPIKLHFWVVLVVKQPPPLYVVGGCQVIAMRFANVCCIELRIHPQVFRPHSHSSDIRYLNLIRLRSHINNLFTRGTIAFYNWADLRAKPDFRASCLSGLEGERGRETLRCTYVSCGTCRFSSVLVQWPDMFGSLSFAVATTY